MATLCLNGVLVLSIGGVTKQAVATRVGRDGDASAGIPATAAYGGNGGASAFWDEPADWPDRALFRRWRAPTVGNA